MPSQKNIKKVEHLTDKFKNSSAMYFTKYSGLDVESASMLRMEFTDNDVDFYVSKNTLTKIAAQNANNETAVAQANAQTEASINQFNSQLADQRERFNVQNQQVIDQANANWRRIHFLVANHTKGKQCTKNKKCATIHEKLKIGATN